MKQLRHEESGSLALGHMVVEWRMQPKLSRGWAGLSETLRETGSLSAVPGRGEAWMGLGQGLQQGDRMCQGPQDKKKLGEFERRTNKWMWVPLPALLLDNVLLTPQPSPPVSPALVCNSLTWRSVLDSLWQLSLAASIPIHLLHCCLKMTP